MAKKKIAMFTDIHFGKRNNSHLHNQDCLDFVKWFCEQVKADPTITHVFFLGDWFENRNAVNVLTLNVADEAMRMLNALGLPVYIIIGNHDLYHRENRKVFSTKFFETMENVHLVSEITPVDDLLIVPYLFKNEYPLLAEHTDKPYWFGHFEFRNFIVTGANRRMEHGPTHSHFKDVKYIFSGHFHKRQIGDNVIYIGNTFPMDYGDVWDDERGMCTFDTETEDVNFIDWPDCPTYRKISLTDLLDDKIDSLPPKCRVKCLIDSDISYSDAQALRDEFIKTHHLREFILEENLAEKKSAIAGEDQAFESFNFDSLNDAVVSMLHTDLSTSTIDSTLLIDIYNSL